MGSRKCATANSSPCKGVASQESTTKAIRVETSCYLNISLPHVLSCLPDPKAGMAFVGDGELKAFKGMFELMRTSRKTLGCDLSAAQAGIGRLRLYLIEDPDKLFSAADALRQEMALTARELTTNSDTSVPLPIKLAVSNSRMVKFLHRVALAHQDFRYQVELVVDGQRHPVPLVHLPAFSDLVPDHRHGKHTTLEIQGFCYGSNGEIWLLTEGCSLKLIVPQDHPQISRSALQDLVTGPLWFDGRIEQLGGGGKWEVMQDAKLVRQVTITG